LVLNPLKKIAVADGTLLFLRAIALLLGRQLVKQKHPQRYQNG
jgi:predicted ATPase